MEPIEGLIEDLAKQRAYVEARCPPYERVLALLPEVLPLDRLAAAWAGRRFGGFYERPLLLLACLRDDALEEGPAHPPYRAVGPDARADAVDARHLADAFTPDRPIWSKLARRHVQTNETSRAVAWMWPAHLLRHRLEEPVDLVDVGASAGLNLVADRLPRVWSREDGAPLAVDPLPVLGVRTGFDERPVDAADEVQARWLLACIWPGQTARLERLEAAVGAWRAASPRPELVACAAGEVPDRLPRGDRTVLAYQTIVRDYLEPRERATYEAGMRRWLAESPPDRAVWVELEHDPSDTVYPARIVAHTARGSFALAACQPHPRALRIDEEQVRAFRDGG